MISIQQRVYELMIHRMGRSNRSALLAISGPSCSGKTTLAKQVAEHAAGLGYGVALVHFDDYLRREGEHPRRAPEHVGYYEDAFDYAGLMGEVRTKSSGAGHPDLLIAEGEFLLRRAYRGTWDASVWIGIEDSVALARGVDRDALFFGSREAAERIYLNRCLPANRLHRRVDEPQEFADIVLRSTANGWLVQPPL